MSERDEFEAWWDRHGQFVRAGGGDYEKCFAYAAWNFRATPQQTVPALTDEQRKELALIARADPSWLIKHLKENTVFDSAAIEKAFALAKEHAAALIAAPQPSQEPKK